MRLIVKVTAAASLAVTVIGTGASTAAARDSELAPVSVPVSVPGSVPGSVPAKAAPPTATTLGQVGVGICNPPTGPAAAVIDTQAPGRASYVAPFDGVISVFAHQANNQPGKVQLLVFADGAASTQKTVVAKSDKLVVATNRVDTFAVRVPIKAGQRLGVGWSATGMACATAADYPGDATLVKGGFDADTSSAFVADGVLSNGTHTFRPNIAAILEPDRDGDGYGDVSQDGCPASAKLQVVCPDTQIDKKPKHRSTRTKARVKIAFSSSIAGSTFQCRLDGHHKWKTCHSPYKKRLGPGRHTLQVRSLSPAGVPDPKPAKARFWIKQLRGKP